MNFLYFFVFFIFIFHNFSSLHSSEETFNYTVEFVGVDDSDTLRLLKAASQTVLLATSPPETRASLQRRVNTDISNLLKALQSLGYYHAQVFPTFQGAPIPIHIIFKIETGPIYPFASLQILPARPEAIPPFPWASISPGDLGIVIGKPALPATIIKAEEELMARLANEGYPLAKLAKREVIADQATKNIHLIFYIDAGPLTTFGKTDLEGNEGVLPLFFCHKISWHRGARYDPKAVERTFNALEASGLFSSINIFHDEEVQPDDSLPMHISVTEAKMRSIAFGIGYATDLGPGVNAEWEHRNFTGLGEKLSFVTNLWQIKQEGFIRYLKPDFCVPRQDLIWKLEVEHEKTKGFGEFSISLSGIIERQLTDQLRISYGARLMRLHNTHSNNNRSFNLFKMPLEIDWNGSNSLMDPTRGAMIHFKAIPSLQILSPRFAYSIQTLRASVYHALDKKARFVLAAKGTWGTIWGATKHDIPPSERFYAGSDILLRGYPYLTVSPLGINHKPIGGRSLMVYSLEARWRFRDPFGAVLFYDIGNVYSQTWPRFKHKQRQAVGIGFRYHTVVGPIRIDLAFPLNRRRHLDKAFQLYFSIGQAF